MQMSFILLFCNIHLIYKFSYMHNSFLFVDKLLLLKLDFINSTNFNYDQNLSLHRISQNIPNLQMIKWKKPNFYVEREDLNIEENMTKQNQLNYEIKNIKQLDKIDENDFITRNSIFKEVKHEKKIILKNPNLSMKIIKNDIKRKNIQYAQHRSNNKNSLIISKKIPNVKNFNISHSSTLSEKSGIASTSNKITEIHNLSESEASSSDFFTASKSKNEIYKKFSSCKQNQFRNLTKNKKQDSEKPLDFVLFEKGTYEMYHMIFDETNFDINSSFLSFLYIEINDTNEKLILEGINFFSISSNDEIKAAKLFQLIQPCIKKLKNLSDINFIYLYIGKIYQNQFLRLALFINQLKNFSFKHENYFLKNVYLYEYMLMPLIKIVQEIEKSNIKIDFTYKIHQLCGTMIMIRNLSKDLTSDFVRKIKKSGMLSSYSNFVFLICNYIESRKEYRNSALINNICYLKQSNNLFYEQLNIIALNFKILDTLILKCKKSYFYQENIRINHICIFFIKYFITDTKDDFQKNNTVLNENLSEKSFDDKTLHDFTLVHSMIYILQMYLYINNMFSLYNELKTGVNDLTFCLEKEKEEINKCQNLFKIAEKKIWHLKYGQYFLIENCEEFIKWDEENSKEFNK